MPCACFRKIMFRYLAFTVKDRWGRLGSRRCDSVHGLPALLVGFRVVGFREAGRGRCDSVRRAPARHCDLGFVRSKNRMRGWSHAYRSHARLEPRVPVAESHGWSHAYRSHARLEPRIPDQPKTDNWPTAYRTTAIERDRPRRFASAAIPISSSDESGLPKW